MKYAIFDMDGTVLDSMTMWETLDYDLMRYYGIEPSVEIHKAVKMLTVDEASSYFHKHFSLSDSPQQISEKTRQMIKDKYLYEIGLKKGVEDVLKEFRKRGISMCIATASDKECAVAALKRLGVLPYFDFVLTADEVGVGKTSPEIFLESVKRFNAPKEQVAVFEDSLHAVETAKRAGFFVVGVFDPSIRDQEEAVIKLCDRYIRTWDECLVMEEFLE
jgi:HAD superfamily hydrolase (TIGR01509 family)